MVRLAVLLLASAGCGRLAFDERAPDAVGSSCSVPGAPATIASLAFGGTGDEGLHRFARASNGGLVATGGFETRGDFGATGGVAAGVNDMYVASFDTTPTFRWAKLYGGVQNDWGGAVAIDAQDRSVVGGRFMATVDFGTGTITSNGDSDLLLAQYAPDGTRNWLHAFGGGGWDDVYDLVLDDSGAVYAAGTIHGTVDYGGGALSSDGAQPDALIASFDANGTYRWAKRFGAASNDWDEAQAIAYRDGVLYVAGNFSQTVDFGVATLTAVGPHDLFVLALDTNGIPLWVHQYGGAAVEIPHEIAVTNNAIYVAGFYTSGATDLGDGAHANAGDRDGFMLALDPAGTVRWARTFGGALGDEARAVAADDCRVVFGGTARAAVDLGLGTLAIAGEADVFVAEYAADGTPVWTQMFGGTGYDELNEVDLDPAGVIWIGGQFTSTIDFGDGPQTASGPSDAYIARFAP